MTSARIFASARLHLIGAPVLPMDAADRYFWQHRAAEAERTRARRAAREAAASTLPSPDNLDPVPG